MENEATSTLTQMRCVACRKGEVASQDRWKSKDGIGSEADVASSHRRTTPWNEG